MKVQFYFKSKDNRDRDGGPPKTIISLGNVRDCRGFVSEVIVGIANVPSFVVGSYKHIHQFKIESSCLSNDCNVLLHGDTGEWIWFRTSDKVFIRGILERYWCTGGGNWVILGEAQCSQAVSRVLDSSVAIKSVYDLSTTWANSAIYEFEYCAITYDDDLLDIKSVSLDEGMARNSVVNLALKYCVDIVTFGDANPFGKLGGQ